MEGLYVFVVSVIWIGGASMSRMKPSKHYTCEVRACKGKIEVMFEEVYDDLCGMCTNENHRCEHVTVSLMCGEGGESDELGLCLGDADCTCTYDGSYCCTPDIQFSHDSRTVHFNCGNKTGTSTNEPGASTNEPGASTNEHGTSTNEPGASTNEPGASTNEPGTSTNEPGASTNEPGASKNEPGASTNEHKVSKNTETLVGGVVGGLIGGVIITAVVVLLWRVCRKRRRHQESTGEQMADTHAYLGPGHTSDSQDKKKGANEKSSSVPDVVKTSVGSDTGECAIISESGDQGDYTEITDDITGAAGGGSVTTASHGMDPQGGRKPQHAADKPDGEYNTLGNATVTKADAKHTYDRLGHTNPDKARLRHTGNNGSGADYFILGESEGNYNRLGHGATAITTGVNSEYNRLGDITEAGNSELTDTGAPSLDYFVLEEPADTYNKLGVDGAATTTDTKNTYDRLGNTDVDKRPRDSEPYEILLKKSGDTYTKLGEKPSADEVEHTYNKLGGATHKREPDVPPDGT